MFLRYLKSLLNNFELESQLSYVLLIFNFLKNGIKLCVHIVKLNLSNKDGRLLIGTCMACQAANSYASDGMVNLFN